MGLSAFTWLSPVHPSRTIREKIKAAEMGPLNRLMKPPRTRLGQIQGRTTVGTRLTPPSRFLGATLGVCNFSLRGNLDFFLSLTCYSAIK
jgi:hypothetical protein